MVGGFAVHPALLDAALHALALAGFVGVRGGCVCRSRGGGVLHAAGCVGVAGAVDAAGLMLWRCRRLADGRVAGGVGGVVGAAAGVGWSSCGTRGCDDVAVPCGVGQPVPVRLTVDSDSAAAGGCGSGLTVPVPGLPALAEVVDAGGPVPDVVVLRVHGVWCGRWCGWWIAAHACDWPGVGVGAGVVGRGAVRCVSRLVVVTRGAVAGRRSGRIWCMRRCGVWCGRRSRRILAGSCWWMWTATGCSAGVLLAAVAIGRAAGGDAGW